MPSGLGFALNEEGELRTSFGRRAPVIAEQIGGKFRSGMRDAFIAEAAMENGLTLVTCDGKLAEVARSFGAEVEEIRPKTRSRFRPTTRTFHHRPVESSVKPGAAGPGRDPQRGDAAAKSRRTDRGWPCRKLRGNSPPRYHFLRPNSQGYATERSALTESTGRKVQARLRRLNSCSPSLLHRPALGDRSPSNPLR
jgi:hypothetical protein